MPTTGTLSASPDAMSAAATISLMSMTLEVRDSFSFSFRLHERRPTPEGARIALMHENRPVDNFFFRLHELTGDPDI
jgi:hypothetical protein